MGNNCLLVRLKAGRYKSIFRYLTACFLILLLTSIYGSAAGCTLGITTDPSQGAWVYILDITPPPPDEWVVEGTMQEPVSNDIVVPCDHCFRVWVRKPERIYAPKNYPNDWAPTADGSAIEGCIGKGGNTPLHFSGDEYVVSIAASKTSYPGGCPGTIVPFTIRVTNDATVGIGATLTSFVITDTLPNGLSYYSTGTSPAPTSISGNVLTWNLNAPISPGEYFEIHLNAMITGSVYGTLTNTVSAQGSTSIGTIVTNQATSTTVAYQNPIATIEVSSSP